jgi:hypothetical protein
MKFVQKAEKLGLKTFDVDMGMFDYTIRFVVGDYKSTIKLVNWFHEDEGWYSDKDEPRGELFRDGVMCPVLWLPRVPRSPIEDSTLAHECVHAVSAMFRWASIPHDLSTDEVFAHAVGFLVQQFKETTSKWPKQV